MVSEENDIPQAVSGLVELTEQNFNAYVARGNHFVQFYAPWCHFCQVT